MNNKRAKETVLEKRNRVLFEQMLQARSLQPMLSLPKVLALLLAILVHATTLIFSAIGLYFLVATVISPPVYVVQLIFFGLPALAIAWAVTPRFLFKRPEGVLPRKTFPAMYRLADRVAKSLDVPAVDWIGIVPYYSAALGRVGVKQETILYIGLPLWLVLTQQEKVALLAHELSHRANGDWSRSFIVGTAIQSLENWYRAMHPPVIAPGPHILLMQLTGAAVWLVLLALRRLLFHESRRAEYLADSLAATISGTDDIVASLEKVHFAYEFFPFVRRMVEMRRTDKILKRFQEYITDLPPEKLFSIDRSRQEKDALYNFTHPPLKYRIEFLKARPVLEPKLRLAAYDSDQIERELRPLEKQVEEILIHLHPNVFINR